MIDGLYRPIWRLSFKGSTAHILETFRRIAGAIVLAKAPLYRDSLKYFLGRPENRPSTFFFKNSRPSFPRGIPTGDYASVIYHLRNLSVIQNDVTMYL